MKYQKQNYGPAANFELWVDDEHQTSLLPSLVILSFQDLEATAMNDLQTFPSGVCFSGNRLYLHDENYPLTDIQPIINHQT